MTPHKLYYLAKVIFTTIFCLLITLPIIASAASVSLAWDQNLDDPDGYRLYYRQDGRSYDFSSYEWSGTGTSCVISGLEDGVTYHFVVRAYAGTVESSNSNEVSYTPFVDSDGDGMPDSWELLYGLDPEVDDASGDPDNDGYTNADEYTGGSSPVNASPNRPQLNLPSDGAMDVTLTPILTAMAYDDPENDQHLKTRYQISLTSDFSSLVYDNAFEAHLLSLPVSELILEPDTTYYWRVRFYDANEGASPWAESFAFTTIDYEGAGDLNGDGVADDQLIESYLDLDNDGTADYLQSNLQGVETFDTLISSISVTTTTTGAVMAGVRAINVSQIPPMDNQPEHLSSAISFRLYLPDGVDSATVEIYFSAPAPQNSSWYKYNIEEGWTAYAGAEFSADRKSVTLVLTDGGPGDQDGVKNGVIVDPAALGYSIQDRVYYSNDTTSVSADGGASGCFIAASAMPGGGNMPWGIIALMAGLLAVMAFHRLFNQMEFGYKN